MKNNKCIICNQEKDLKELKTRPQHQEFCESCWRNNNSEVLSQYQYNYTLEQGRKEKFTSSSGIIDYAGWIAEIEEQIISNKRIKERRESLGICEDKEEKTRIVIRDRWLEQELIRLRTKQIEVSPK